MKRVAGERQNRGDDGQIFSTGNIIELYEPIVKGVATYSGVMCDSCAAMSSEWISFLNRRLHTDLSLGATLARCQTPQEAMEEWSNFLITAASDYRTEFERLAEISTRTSEQVAASVHNGRMQSQGP